MLQRAPIRTLTQMRNVHSTDSPEPAALSAPPTEIRLYKGSFLMPLRILLRAKLAQLGYLPLLHSRVSDHRSVQRRLGLRIAHSDLCDGW